MRGDKISREALLRKAQTINLMGAKMKVILVEDVEEAPALDDAPVIRCKDCMHYNAPHVLTDSGEEKS